MKHILITGVVLGILCASIGVFVGVYFIWRYPYTQKEKPTSLSIRSQEFLAQQRAHGDAFWSQTRIEERSDRTPEVLAAHTTSTQCFTLTMPMSVIHENIREEQDQCVYEARDSRRKADIHVTFQPHGEGKPLQEDSGVLFRERSKDLFTEIPRTYANVLGAKQFRSADSVTTFLDYPNATITIAISSLSTIDDQVFRDIDAIVASVNLR